MTEAVSNNYGDFQLFQPAVLSDLVLLSLLYKPKPFPRQVSCDGKDIGEFCIHGNRTEALIYVGVFFPSPPRAFSALLPWLLHVVQHIKPPLLVLTSPLVRLTVYEQNSNG